MASLSGSPSPPSPRSLRVAGAPTPTPTPHPTVAVPVRAGLYTNGQYFRRQQPLVLYYQIIPNVPPEALQGVGADAYVALLTPKGLLWYVGRNMFSSTVSPIARYESIAEMAGTASWFITRNGKAAEGVAGEVRMEGMASGFYVWLGLLCRPGTSPLDQGNWMSNLAYAPFTYQR